MAKGKSVIINMDKDKGVIWEPAPTPVPALPSDGFGAQVSVPPLRWFGCPGLSAPASIGWFGCACPCATGINFFYNIDLFKLVGFESSTYTIF
jgi:hypothetical protein